MRKLLLPSFLRLRVLTEVRPHREVDNGITYCISCMNAQSTILNFSLRPRSLTRSHVAALSPEPLRVDPGDEVEGVHVAVHAHRNAFLNDRCRDERI